MTEQGEQYWNKAALTTDWKTRRAQQDAYRKALDEQIQQRKMINLKGKVRETPQQVAKDPVQHLMPWIGNENQRQAPAGKRSEERVNSNSHRQPIDNLIDNATALPPPARTPSEQQGQTYFYGPPAPAPEAFQESSSCEGHQSSANMTNGNSPEVIPHPNNVAYGYYKTSSIPPPPEYTEGPSYRPDYPYKTNNQPPSSVGQEQGLESSSTLQRNSQTLLAPGNADAAGIPDHPCQNDTDRTAGNLGMPGLAEMPVRRHISQTSEETPNQTKGYYRDELSRQIEERRKMEEERKKLEKLEEERLQRKVQEDQERMTREYEEEQRRRKAKEEEKRQQERDILERTRKAQKLEEVRRKQEKEQKRLLKEQTLRAEASERRKAVELAKNLLVNPFDSTPILSSSLSIGESTCEEGQGDSLEVMVGRLSKPKGPPINHDEVLACVGNMSDTPVTSGFSKSVEERNLISTSSLKSYGDDIPICSNCFKSYSSDDIQIRQESEANQLDGLKFLNQFRSVLVAEKEKVDERIKARKERAAFKPKIKISDFGLQF